MSQHDSKGPEDKGQLSASARDPILRAYRPPQLRALGSLRNLTTGGSGDKGESNNGNIQDTRKP